MRLALCTCLATVLVTHAGSAYGTDKDSVAADALFRAGRDALAQGDLVVACARFAESYGLEPTAGTTLNLADCEERTGRLAVALMHFSEVRDALAPRDFRTPVVARRIAELERRVPRLSIIVPAPMPPGASIDCDGVTLGAGSVGVGLPVDPGAHVCVMHVPGRADSRLELTLREAERVTAVFPPTEPLPTATSGDAHETATPKPETPAARPSVERPSSNGNKAAIYILGATGIAGVVVGATAGIAALSAASTYRAHCNPTCDLTGVDAASTGRTMAVVSPVAFGVGLAGLAGAAVVFALGRSSTSTRVTITPTVASAPGASFALSF